MSNDRKIDGYGPDEILCSGVVMITLKILKKLEWQSRLPRLILLRNRRKFHVPTGQMKTTMARRMKMLRSVALASHRSANRTKLRLIKIMKTPSRRISSKSAPYTRRSHVSNENATFMATS